MGDEIEVISAVRDFPSEEKADVIDDGGEIVLIKVSIKPGEEYGGCVSAGDFQLSWDDGADYWMNKNSILEDEMNDADFSPLEDLSRRDGGETTGWIAYTADEKKDTYKIEYTRRGAKVIGSDKTIDEFQKHITIPAA